MPRASTMPGEMLGGGFFRAGRYLVLAASYQQHQFITKDNKAVGKPGIMAGLELIQVGEGEKVELVTDAVRLEQWYPVGGNLEMFYPSDANDKKVAKGQFVGSPSAHGIFEDSGWAQFCTALINAGYDRERWKEHDIFGLTGAVLVLSEVQDKKAPAPEASKGDSRMAQEAKEAGANDKTRPRTIVVPSECLLGCDGDSPVHGAELPKAKWPKGTPATVTKPGDRKKDGAAKTNGTPTPPAETTSNSGSDNGGGELSAEDQYAVLQDAIRTTMEGKASMLAPIFKGALVKAINAVDGVSDADKDAIKAMVGDAAVFSSAMTDTGFKLDGNNWKPA